MVSLGKGQVSGKENVIYGWIGEDAAHGSKGERKGLKLNAKVQMVTKGELEERFSYHRVPKTVPNTAGEVRTQISRKMFSMNMDHQIMVHTSE